MTEKDIDRLMSKYYEGLTDEREEDMLLRYFSSGDVPESMADDRDFFIALHGCGKAAGVPEGLERRMEEHIDSWSRHQAEPAARPECRPAPKPTLKARLRRACGMAASVAAVAMLGAYLHGRNPVNAADQAKLAQARTALTEFSNTLNKGFDKMEEAHKKTKEINKSIDKCLRLINTDKQ